MQNILVVDDSRVVRLAVRRILESLGFSVSEAVDGQGALRHLQSVELPAAVILDVIMPGLDGIACLRAIRADPKLKECPVIMCTSRIEPEEIHCAVVAGANEYIMKPFTEEILAEKLRQVGLLQ